MKPEKNTNDRMCVRMWFLTQQQRPYIRQDMVILKHVCLHTFTPILQKKKKKFQMLHSQLVFWHTPWCYTWLTETQTKPWGSKRHHGTFSKQWLNIQEEQHSAVINITPVTEKTTWRWSWNVYTQTSLWQENMINIYMISALTISIHTHTHTTGKGSQGLIGNNAHVCVCQRDRKSNCCDIKTKRFIN